MFTLLSTSNKLQHDVGQQVNNKTDIISRYLASIKWDFVFSQIITGTILIFFISLIFFIINFIGKLIIKRSFKHSKNGTQMTSSRVSTVYTLTLNTFHYTILFFYLYAILSILGVPVGTLLAGAGIFSVALGLGAQGFVNDVITGAFILLEQQLSIGESVKIGNISGKVYAVGLRTTQILSQDGTLHFMPNRSITTISNLSRNNMLAQIDIPLDPNLEIISMIEVIKHVNQTLKTKYYDKITHGPNIIGIVDTGNGNMVLRIDIYAKNGSQFEIKRIFLIKYLENLTKNGYTIQKASN